MIAYAYSSFILILVTVALLSRSLRASESQRASERIHVPSRVIVSDGLSRHVLSRDMVFVSRSWLNLDTCMSCLGSVWSFNVSSCLLSHDCILTVSLSGIAKCLLCVKTLAFLAASRQLDHLLVYLLTYCKTVVLVVVIVLWH